MPGVYGDPGVFRLWDYFGMNNSHLHESLHGTPFKTRVLNG